jgi:hypothetical protein
MNSLDPWRVIATDVYGDVVLPPPYYGHPFYREVPSWIHYGDSGDGGGGDSGGGTSRLLFDGAFVGADPVAEGAVSGWVDIIGANNMTNIIGAELTALSVPGAFYGRYGYPYGPFLGADAPVAQRTGLTAEVAPIVAPATGGITVKKELDAKQVLHVEICVDGKCHKTSMDLAPAISMVMQKLARWHEGMHAAMQPPPPSTVVSTVQNAVGAAEDALVGALVARHVDTVCGSFLGDIAGVVKSATRGLAGGVANTFKKFKGPIGGAAALAAMAGASAIPGIGPIAAPIAGKLANDLVQAGLGDAKAKKAVAKASKEALTDPAVKLALEQATKAVANSTVAHHVQDTAKKAARGDSKAQQDIVKVADDAQKGDPGAKAVADLVANAMKSEWGAKLWEKATGRGPETVSGWYDVVGSWYDIVGAAIDDIRANAKAYAGTKSGNASGVIQTVDGRLHGRGFRSLDEAVDWLQRSTHDKTSFTYAAAYEKAADGTAYIQAEEFGGTARPAPTPTPIPREGPALTGWWY